MQHDDFSDMEAMVLNSGLAPSLGRLRRHFADFRAQLVTNGFAARLPRPMSSAGVHDDMAVNLFTLMALQAVKAPVTRKYNAPLEHNLRNMLSYYGVPMLQKRGRWKS